MTINELLRTLFRAWWVLVIAAGVGLLVAMGLRATTPPVFSSSSEILVAVDPRSDSLDEMQNAQTLSRVIAQNAVLVISSSAILDAASDKLMDATSSHELADSLTVTNSQGSSVVQIAVATDDPSAARDSANAIADAFISFALQSPEFRPGGEGSAVTITVLSQAKSGTVVEPESSRDLLVGAGIGLLIGGVTAFLVDKRHRRRVDD